MAQKIKQAAHAGLMLFALIFKNSIYASANTIFDGNSLLISAFFGVIASITLLLICPVRKVISMLPVIFLLCLLGWAMSDGKENKQEFIVPFFMTQILGFAFINREEKGN